MKTEVWLSEGKSAKCMIFDNIKTREYKEKQNVIKLFEKYKRYYQKHKWSDKRIKRNYDKIVKKYNLQFPGISLRAYHAVMNGKNINGIFDVPLLIRDFDGDFFIDNKGPDLRGNIFPKIK